MAEAKEVGSEEVLRRGVRALVERLGPADAVRFIAAFGGRGDSVKEIRKMRDGETATVEELVARIRAREKSRGMRA